MKKLLILIVLTFSLLSLCLAETADKTIKGYSIEREQELKNSLYKEARDSYNIHTALKEDSLNKLKLGYKETKINEEMALVALRSICISWVVFYADNNTYPHSLFDLVNMVPSYLDKDFDDSRGNPKVFGYEFSFFPLEGHKFYAVAKPIIEGKTGNKYFIIDQRGIIVEDLNKNGIIDTTEEDSFRDKVRN